MKVDIPLTYADESKQLSDLTYKFARTDSGEYSFISATSGETYSTNDYPDDPNIFNKGEEGMIFLIRKVFGGDDGFLLLAKDTNEYIRPSGGGSEDHSPTPRDADTLDGKEPKYYLDYDNFVNTPLPDPPKVSSVFGREGDIVAQAGDYTPEQVGATPAAHALDSGIHTTPSEKLLAATITYTPEIFEVIAAIPAPQTRATLLGYTTQPYANGDTMTINGVPVELTDLTGEPLSDGAWGNDSGLAVPVQLMVDLGAGRAFFNAGGGGEMGAKFLQYTLPSSSTFGNPQQWYYDDSVQFPEEPYCGKVVGDECYLLSKAYIFVLNLKTGVYSSLAHGLVISENFTSTQNPAPAAVEFQNHIFFSFYYGSNQIMRINITSKIITLEPKTGYFSSCKTLLVDEDAGIMYLTGGFDKEYGASYVNSSVSLSSMYAEMHMRQAVSMPWAPISNPTIFPATYVHINTSNRLYMSAKSSVGFNKGGKFYVASYNTSTGYSTSTITFAKLFVLNSGTVEEVRNVNPAFVPSSYNGAAEGNMRSIGGTKFKGHFVSVFKTNMQFWEPGNNTVYGDLPIAPVDDYNPNAVISHENQSELRVYKADGMQRLYFQPPVIPENIAPVLIIYKGQKYHGDKLLEIKHDGVVVHTITEEWQVATDDIEIKRGQYDSAWDYRVYVENK